MHELAFADAVRPTPVVVLNLPLLDYSIGHELLLLQRRNALLLLSPGQFSTLEFRQQAAAIREIVWICSDKFSERDRFERTFFRLRWSELKCKIWLRRLKKLLLHDYALAEADLRNYLDAGRRLPPVAETEATEIANGEEPGSNSGRNLGAPFILSLHVFVASVIRPNINPLDYSYSLAAWQYFASLENEGRIRIENWKEAEVKQEMVGHIAALAAEEAEEAKKQSEDSALSTLRRASEDGRTPPSAPEPGLATPLPDLSDDSALRTPPVLRSTAEGGHSALGKGGS